MIRRKEYKLTDIQSPKKSIPPFPDLFFSFFFTHFLYLNVSDLKTNLHISQKTRKINIKPRFKNDNFTELIEGEKNPSLSGPMEKKI